LAKFVRSASSIDSIENKSVHFKPTVRTLAEKEPQVDLDEEVMYCQRAKLFRFSNGDWKDQGVGDVKVLRHRSTGKTR